MIDWIVKGAAYFLKKFWSPPTSGGSGGTQFSWGQIIPAESTHFLLSLFWGWLVFSLTWTILSSSKFKEYDHFMWNISLLFGLSASVTTHILVDAYTNLA